MHIKQFSFEKQRMATWNEGWDAPGLGFSNPWYLPLSNEGALGINETLGGFCSTQQKKAQSNL